MSFFLPPQGSSACVGGGWHCTLPPQSCDCTGWIVDLPDAASANEVQCVSFFLGAIEIDDPSGCTISAMVVSDYLAATAPYSNYTWTAQDSQYCALVPVGTTGLDDLQVDAKPPTATLSAPAQQPAGDTFFDIGYTPDPDCPVPGATGYTLQAFNAASMLVAGRSGPSSPLDLDLTAFGGQTLTIVATVTDACGTSEEVTVTYTPAVVCRYQQKSRKTGLLVLE